MTTWTKQIKRIYIDEITKIEAVTCSFPGPLLQFAGRDRVEEEVATERGCYFSLSLFLELFSANMHTTILASALKGLFS